MPSFAFGAGAAIRPTCWLVAAVAALFPGSLAAAAPARSYDFTQDVLPILEKRCSRCHGANERNAGLRLHNAEAVRKGGITESFIVPGQSQRSYLLRRVLGLDNEDRMPPPPKNSALTADEIEILRGWIDQGARFPEEDRTFRPSPAGLRRLTDDQYRNAIRDVLGVTIDAPLHPAADPGKFTNVLAYGVTTVEWSVELYRATALRVALRAFADPDRRRALLGCDLRRSHDGCARAYLERVGRLLWRRPLSADEVEHHVSLARRIGRSSREPWKGLAGATSALLQSPHFLYSREEGEPDGDDPERLRLSAYDLATRMALFLWSSVPDDRLLQAAGRGALDTEEGVRAEARRMVASPKAREGTATFFSEWLELGELERLAKDPALYPGNTAGLRRAMAEEVRRMIDRIVFVEHEDVLALFDTRRTFVNAELARHYGIPGEFPEDAFVPVTLPESGPRMGLLGTAAFLARNALATRSSPTERGVSIRERLLCQEVPPPPPNVVTDLREAKEEATRRTMRERMSRHATEKRCASCHRFFDPIGLALEHFDALGAYRDTDGGLVIDATGELDGVAYDGLPGLARRMRNHPRADACLIDQLFRFATGHEATKGERPVVDSLLASFRENGRDLSKLLVDLAASDAFRYVSPPLPDNTPGRRAEAPARPGPAAVASGSGRRVGR